MDLEITVVSELPTTQGDICYIFPHMWVFASNFYLCESQCAIGHEIRMGTMKGKEAFRS